jgi:hypothetical protein
MAIQGHLSSAAEVSLVSRQHSARWEEVFDLGKMHVKSPLLSAPRLPQDRELTHLSGNQWMWIVHLQPPSQLDAKSRLEVLQ